MLNRIRSEEQHEIFNKGDKFIAFIKVDIDKNDTLLSLSMKYNCTIIDIKRLNSLQNDRDMYALNNLKIPIKKHSSLAAKYESKLEYCDINFTRLTTNAALDHNIEKEINSVYSDSDDAQSTIEPSSSTNQNDMEIYEELNNYTDNSPLISNIETIHNETSKTNNKDAKRFFKKKDKELNSLKTQSNDLSKKSEQLIPISNYSIESKSNSLNWSNNFFNGRDVIVIACFIVILIPLIIFIYEFYYYDSVRHL